MLYTDSLDLTESEAAVLSILAKKEGKDISDEYLCERALLKPMTDNGLEVARLIGSLREKLRDSGYWIRRTSTEIEEEPGEAFSTTEYALTPLEDFL